MRFLLTLHQSSLRSEIKHVLLLVVVLGSCKTFVAKKSIYAATEVVSFTAFDLSEDRSVLSTQDDEIVVLLFQIDTESNTFLNGSTSGLIQVKAKGETRLLNMSIPHKPDSVHALLYLCLFEIDEDDNSISKVQDIVTDYFMSEGSVGSIDKMKLDSLVGDNDFLGYTMIPQLAAEKETLHTIKGKQALDDFNYQFIVRREQISN